MPAPSNTSANTAIDLGAIPWNVVQNVNDSGTTYTVWYKGTIPTDANEISMWANGGFAGGAGSYQTILQVYDGLANAIAVTPYLGGFGNGSHPDCPAQIPVDDAQILYFRIQSKNGDVATAILTLDGIIAPAELVPAGSILVNDHSNIGANIETLPLVMFSGVDGSLLNFYHPFAAGEQVATLNDGSTLVESMPLSPKGIRLYNADLSLRTTVLYDHTPVILSSNKVDTFYIGNQDDNHVTTCDSTGVFGPTTWNLTGLSFELSFMCPSLDDTILYYAGDNSNQPIKRWDLVNNIVMTNLAAGIASQTCVGILVLDDGTIVVAYQAFGIQNFCKRFAADGTLLNTYNITNSPPDEIGKGDASSQALARSIASDDPNSFWVWVSGALAVADFRNIKVSDGSVINSFPVSQFEVGVYEEAATPQPDPDRFGHSDSCPFWIAQQETIAPPPVPGTIVVVKVNTIVNDETEFDFVATNLTPTSFTLSGIAPDDIATYASVAVGDGYGITETVPTGWVATYDVSNESPHTNISVGDSETVTVTVTNTFSPPSTGTDEPVRRMRQFTIPSAENFWIFLEKIELEFQRGGGLVTGLGEDPQIMFQLSRDGGKTWGPERWLSAGKLGAYKQRAIWRKLGRARNPVARFIVSDPVFWALQDCYIEAIKGTS